MPNSQTSATPFVDEAILRSLVESTRPIQGYDELSAMLADIRPVLRNNTGLRYVDIDRMDVNYGSIYVAPALGRNLELREHSKIMTLHRFSFYSQFEPKIREVLQSVPLDLPESVVAFEVVNPLDGDYLKLQKVALNHGYHVAWTILYELDA